MLLVSFATNKFLHCFIFRNFLFTKLSVSDPKSVAPIRSLLAVRKGWQVGLTDLNTKNTFYMN